MKVLVEQNVIAEVRVVGELRMVFEHWPTAICLLQEKARQTTAQFRGHLVKGEEFSGPSRTFDLELISVVIVKTLQGLDDEIVNWQPDGPTPVRVAAEQCTARLSRPVPYFVVRAAGFEAERFLLVNLRQSAHAVFGQEALFVEHPAEQRRHPVTAQQ